MLTQPQFAKAAGGDVAETGAGPGSYNIHHNVWHVNCCSPKFNGGAGWGVFYASTYPTSPPYLTFADCRCV